jgi:hypothetical protein
MHRPSGLFGILVWQHNNPPDRIPFPETSFLDRRYNCQASASRGPLCRSFRCGAARARHRDFLTDTAAQCRA